jgi:hypothetical protein
MHFPGLCPQKLAGAKRFRVRSRLAGPLLRVELARGAAGSKLPAKESGPARRDRTPKATGVAWGRARKEFFKIDGATRECL